MTATGTYKIEQITATGSIIFDYDQPLTASAQQSLYEQYFTNVHKVSGGFTVSHKGNEYLLLTKNVTYLGHPWPPFKKRIQVPSSWNVLLQKHTTVLIGIYHYADTVLFVFFDKKPRGKNSAAHVSSIDLLKAQQYGTFEKKDKNGNRIIACTSATFLDVFAHIVAETPVPQNEEIALLSDFFHSLPRHWDGITCYTEMFAAHFAHRRQGEWPGFYAEYKLNTFLDTLPTADKDICAYVQNKKKGTYDLDLEFKRRGFLGDLKTHSIESSGIPGNDKETFMRALEEFGTLWYVVLNLSYTHDRDNACVVSAFWNTAINTEEQNTRKALDSYCNRMKHSGTLLSMHILEFNAFNTQYISDFTQGKQPNGAPREVKIQIEKKNIDNFVIFRQDV